MKFIAEILTSLFITSILANELQITNYTLSHLVTINNGQAKIQDGTFKIIHVTRLDQYASFLNNIRTFMEENIPKSNSFFPLLNLELSQITNILNSIEPIHKFRNKRSINMLGTAWKYIAGTPDHDDFEMVKDIIDKNNINNNKQVLINQAFSDRINNLTTITNMLSNAIRKDNRLIDEIALLLQTKIRLVKDELKDVKNAIQWAKNNVINSSLLDKKEIDVTLSKLREENILFTSTEEALSFADIDILYNGTTLLYVVKIPLTSRENCVNIILKPVRREIK